MEYTIFDCLMRKCKDSTIGMMDINPQVFFGRDVIVPAPLDEVDILEYFDSLSGEFMESEYKMAISNGTVTKVDVDVIDCMLDTEDVAYRSLFTYEDYTHIIRHLQVNGKKNSLYLVSREYYAEDNSTSWCIMELGKEI